MSVGCVPVQPPRDDEGRGSRGASKHGCVGQGYGVLKPFLLLRNGAAVHWLESQPTVARPSRATRDKGIVMAGVYVGERVCGRVLGVLASVKSFLFRCTEREGRCPLQQAPLNLW